LSTFALLSILDCLLSFIRRSKGSQKNEENEVSTPQPAKDVTPVLQMINTLSTNLASNVPSLKRDLYIQLLRFAAESRRNDLTTQLAEQCIRENFKLGGSMNEIDSLTGYALPRDIVEQLARYKPGEQSWNEKLASMDVTRASRTKLEQIYDEAKHDGRYPPDVQHRLLDIYVQKKSIQQSFKMLHEMISNGQQVCIDTKRSESSY
jgi:hypothetical protein